MPLVPTIEIATTLKDGRIIEFNATGPIKDSERILIMSKLSDAAAEISVALDRKANGE